MKKLEVSAGIIINKDKILCVQRDKGKYDYISYKFEFPGGKVEEGEDSKEALRRELMEEMQMDIKLESMKHFMTVHHEYPDFEITMHSYICLNEQPEFVLMEHIDHKWLRAEELGGLDWAAADLPIVHALVNS